MADPTKFTAKEVLNKVLLDSSGNAVSANSVTSQEALSMALDATNNRLNVALEGGTISGDVTISGDLTVTGNGGGTYDEIISGNVRIGTNVETANTNFDNLVIEGSSHTGISIFSGVDSSGSGGTDSDGGIYFGDNANNNRGQIKYSHSSNSMSFTTDDTTALTIDSSQNVGIGLSSSIDKKLHIASSTSTDGITIENTSTGATQIRFEADSSALRGLIGVDDSNGNAFLASTNGKAYVMCLRSEGEMHFGTNGNNVALQLDTSQNATFAGDVNISSGKNINFSPSVYTSAVQGIKFDQDGGTTDSIIQPVRLTGNSGVIIYLGSNSFVNTSGGSDRYNDSNASSAIEVRPEGQIRFLTGGTGADPTEKMNINSDASSTFSGDVKIENSSASAELEFKRTSSNTANFKIQAYNDIFELYDLANSKSKFKFDDNSRFSLSNTDDGTSNTIIGKNAGDSDGVGDFNVFVGELSGGTGTQTDDADGNVGVGYRALTDVTSGNQNIALGKDALTNITSGDSNIGIGSDALGTATSAEDIIAIGRNAGYAVNSDGADGTVAIGRNALTSLTAGEANVAVGYQALSAEDAGSKSTAVGYQALTAQTGTTGTVGNVAIGYQAGNNITTGMENTIIGAFSTIGAVNGQNQIVIGNGVSGEGDNKAVIGNVSITDVYMAKDSGATVHADKYMSTTMPAFQAIPSAAQNNIAINTAVTIVLGTEVFDQGSNFASNTFTAPVTGKYQLNANVRFIDIDSAADYYYMWIVTSNRTYTHTIFDPDFGQDAAYWSLSFSVLADMDASDTAYVALYQGGGTQQTDIAVGAGETIFSGYLVC